MKIAAVEGIRLSHSSAAAWRAAGVEIMYGRRLTAPLNFIQAEVDVLINLGSRASSVTTITALTPDLRLFNPTKVVEATSSRVLFESILGEMLPIDTIDGGTELRSVWLKGPGRGGRNKLCLSIEGAIVDVPAGYTIERHIEGEEWRLHTVNEAVVQSHRRLGTNDDRIYEWVGVRATPIWIRNTVKEAVRKLHEYTNNADMILAWDVIYDDTNDKTYILEANSCPGMNEATAQRIIDYVRRIA